MSWEPAEGGILSSLKRGFFLMLWLASVPEAWDAFLWGGGTSGEHRGSEDSSGLSLEFALLKSRTQWVGTTCTSWEDISQARSFLRATMTRGLVIASQSSSSWSLNRSLERKSTKNLDGEIHSEGSSYQCRSSENSVSRQVHSYAKTHMLILSYSVLTFLHMLFCSSLSCILFTCNYKHFKTKNILFFPFVRLWHTYFCWYITWQSAKWNW